MDKINTEIMIDGIDTERLMREDMGGSAFVCV